MSSPKPRLPAELPRHRKRRGEWAEMKFMAEAAARSLTVLKPYGDSARYDFAVSNGDGPLHRVQVKSTSVCRNYAYQCDASTGNRSRPYSPKQIDFLAAFVIPCEAWYVIPSAAFAGRSVVSVFPHKPNSRGRYEKYREAWHLLLE